MIILVGGEKGGTGKTTIATNLAARLKDSGADVLLVDTDKQGSASSWAAMREEQSHIESIPTIQKFGNSIVSAINDLKNRYDHLIIDAGGRDSVELRAAMTVCDRLYIPLQASQFDIWTLGTMDKLVEQAKGFNPDILAYVIINRASPNPSVSEVLEAQEMFNDFSHLKLSDVVVKDRIAYRKAARSGCSVSELPTPDSKAIEELNKLYDEVFYDKAKNAA